MDAEIVDRAQKALAAVLKETARRRGGMIREEDGLLLVAANHPCPVLVNSALRTGSMDATEVLQRARAFFGKLNRGWETWIREGADADLQQAAETMGLCAAPELIGMVLDSRPDFGDVPGGVEFCWVGDTPGVRDFVSVATDGFREEAPGLPDLIRAIFSERASLVASDTAAFVVRYRGEPAATALAMVKEDVAWIGWVATRAITSVVSVWAAWPRPQRPVPGSRLEPSWRHWRPRRWVCRFTCVSASVKSCDIETTGRQDSEVDCRADILAEERDVSDF